MQFTIFRHIRSTRAATPIPSTGGLKASDYTQAVAIVSGIVAAAFGGSGVTGIVSVHTALEVAFFAGLIATAGASLSQWLQSKGD